MNVYWKKLALPILMLLSVVVLSAFRFDNSHIVTRIQLADLIGMVLLQTLPDLNCSEAEFPDLDAGQKKQVAVVANLAIMNGFFDGKYRPEMPLRNHEVLHYLDRAWQFLKANAPESRTERKIGRIVGLGRREFYRNQNSSYSIFPEMSKGFDYTEKATLKRIRDLLISDSHEQKLTLIVEDSLTRNPLVGAFVAVNDKALVANESGIVMVENLKDEELEILVSAPGYVPLKLKRSFLQKKKVRLRLRPVRPKVLIRAFSEKENLPLSEFEARIDDSNWKKACNGKVEIRGQLSGYHQIQVRKEKSEIISRNVFLSEDPVKLEMKL